MVEKMRLDDFEQEAVGEFVRYSMPVIDEAGEPAHELLVLGSEQQIRESFGESDFEVTIRPGERKSLQELEQHSQEQWPAELSRRLPSAEALPRTAFDDLRAWFKQPPPAPSAEDSILVALRSERPGGTYSNFFTTGSVTLLQSIFFVPFPPVFWSRALAAPRTGDVDMFMERLGSAGLSQSNQPGLAWEFVLDWVWPWQSFIPRFRVLGAAGSSSFIFVAEAFGL
jgi:hypothetical protein